MDKKKITRLLLFSSSEIIGEPNRTAAPIQRQRETWYGVCIYDPCESWLFCAVTIIGNRIETPNVLELAPNSSEAKNSKEHGRNNE